MKKALKCGQSMKGNKNLKITLTTWSIICVFGSHLVRVKKTSIRVTENQEQMAEDGLFTGGSAGFGYRLVFSGLKNKKGKDLFKREIVEEDAKIIDDFLQWQRKVMVVRG